MDVVPIDSRADHPDSPRYAWGGAGGIRTHYLVDSLMSIPEEEFDESDLLAYSLYGS